MLSLPKASEVCGRRMALAPTDHSKVDAAGLQVADGVVQGHQRRGAGCMPMFQISEFGLASHLGLLRV